MVPKPGMEKSASSQNSQNSRNQQEEILAHGVLFGTAGDHMRNNKQDMREQGAEVCSRRTQAGCYLSKQVCPEIAMRKQDRPVFASFDAKGAMGA